MSTGSVFLDWVNQIFFNISPEQEEILHQQIISDYGLEPTAPEEDQTNYVENIKRQGTMRTVSYSDDGFMHWQEYVTDRNGKKVVVASGDVYVGWVGDAPAPDGSGKKLSDWLESKATDYDQRALLTSEQTEREPVYKRLQGGHR